MKGSRSTSKGELAGMCAWKRGRENMQDREKVRNHEKISMLEGVVVSVSASRR